MSWPNHAMHTDSSLTSRFQSEDHWLGAGDGNRSV
jgi:hypothetical protein